MYHRTADGFDRDVITGLNAKITLKEIGCELSLAEICEEVKFSAELGDSEW